MRSAPLITQIASIALFGLAPVDVVGADVKCQQRHFAGAAMLAQEAFRRHHLRAARRIAPEQEGVAGVALAGEEARRGLASAAELDELQAGDPPLLDGVQLVGVALVGVDSETGGVGLHALCQRVAQRQVVAGPRAIGGRRREKREHGRAEREARQAQGHCPECSAVGAPVVVCCVEPGAWS